jgi:hypothetical protein
MTDPYLCLISTSCSHCGEGAERRERGEKGKRKEEKPKARASDDGGNYKKTNT